MKKILIPILLFIFSFNFSYASQINLYLFSSDSCPHCKAEKNFLSEISQIYPQLKIYEFEVSKSDSVQKFQTVARHLNADIRGVPFTVIGNEYFEGFSVGITDVLIENKIKFLIKNNVRDTVGPLIGIELNENLINQENETQKDIQNIETPNKEEPILDSTEKETVEDGFNLPIIGSVDLKNFSIPVLTVIFGLLDGFNPCAMWVLLFLISLLIGMQDKKKRWILGFAFIFTSAIVYYFFMALWLNLIIFLSFVFWIQILIGVVAITGGAYSLRKGFDKTSGCSIAGESKRKKIIDRMKNIVTQKSFILSLIGIIILAFSVNLVELLCSAGLPAVYTQVLALNNLSFLQYYGYLGLYVLLFMIDDLVVFIVAMKTLEITGLTTKYSKYTRIIGGVLMIIIGFLLIFKPEWIMFG